ncbi:hypothetical protein GCM10020216_007960 [Nonomuraea helvata]
MPPTGLADGFGRGSALWAPRTEARRFTPEKLRVPGSASSRIRRPRHIYATSFAQVKRGLGNAEGAMRRLVLPQIRLSSTKVFEWHVKVQAAPADIRAKPP